MHHHESKSKPKPKEFYLVRIVPLRDHVLTHNEFKYVLKKGVTADVDPRFLEVLTTEKVINKGNL